MHIFKSVDTGLDKKKKSRKGVKLQSHGRLNRITYVLFFTNRDKEQLIITVYSESSIFLLIKFIFFFNLSLIGKKTIFCISYMFYFVKCINKVFL